MGQFWLIYKYILKDLKKIDALVQEAPRERYENHNPIYDKSPKQNVS